MPRKRSGPSAGGGRRSPAWEKDLLAAAQQLRAAVEPAGAGVWWSRDNRLYLSPISARMYGLPVSDNAGEGALEFTCACWEHFVLPEDLPKVQAAFGSLPAADTSAIEFRTTDAVTGKERWIHAPGRVVRDEATGEIVGCVGLYIDMTARREMEERLRLSEERLALALASGEDGIVDHDAIAGTTWVSPHLVERLGYESSDEPRPARFWRDAVHPDDALRVREAAAACLHGLAATMDCEFRIRRADGDHVWIALHVRPADRTADGRVSRVIGTIRDVTRRKEAEARVERMSLHDDLTELPNRRFFTWRLERLLGEITSDGPGAVVLSLDIDGFTAINDTLGRAVGDRVLVTVSERLRAATRTQDAVARMNADAFAVLLRDLEGTGDFDAIARRIVEVFAQPVLIGDVRLDIDMSIGAVFVTGGMSDAENVIRQAEIARIEAKQANLTGVQLCNADMVAKRSLRSRLALAMRESIRLGHFHLEYQPVIDVRCGRIASMEALMRWEHPLLGSISPCVFIPVAEETGHIARLGAWALGEACREALEWPADIRVAVNVSAVQFDGSFEDVVRLTLQETGLPADRLKLEVTETTLMKKPDAALALLGRLQALGIRIALDDFGTGYSSLSYLRDFPFDKLKIDRAFIRDIANHEAGAIVRAMVGMGERLGMGIVAEGVETPEQFDLVRREGCTEVQGHLFSSPLRADAARAYIRDFDSATAMPIGEAD